MITVERKNLGPKGAGPAAPRARKNLGSDEARQQAYGPYRSVREEEPVDAETVGDFGHKARQRWHETRERVRENFGARTRERVNDYHKAHQAEQDRAADEDPRMSERDQLLKLRAQTRQAGEKYMTSLAESNILAPGFNDKSPQESEQQAREEKFDAMHHVYTQMMVQACMRPLSRGVNSQSVIQAVGMMTAMTLLSKDFRSQVGDQLEPLKEKMQGRIDNKTRSVAAAASQGVETRSRLFGGIENDTVRGALVGNTDPRSHLSRKWQRRLDDLQRRERGNRDMFTPESAAMTEIGLMENAFTKLREPGVDPDQVKTSYKAMIHHVRSQFDQDGLDRGDVVDRMKLLAGARMEHEPELASMFVGVSHGLIERDQVVNEKTGQRQWGGSFVSCTGAQIPPEGMFPLRPPMGEDQHRQAMTQTMQHTLGESLSRGDGQGVRDGVFGYMVAFAGRKQGLDTSGSPSAQRAETMLASMEIDGLEEDQQREAYSMAYVNALENVGAQQPELEQTLARTIGANWRERLQQAVDDPARFMAEEASRPRAREAGPSPGPEPADTEPDSDYQPA